MSNPEHGGIEWSEELRQSFNVFTEGVRVAISNAVQLHEDELRMQIGELRAENDTLREQNTKLREALEAVEWDKHPDDEDAICQWCERTEWLGHAPGCQRQAALGLEEDDSLTMEAAS